MNEPHCYGKMDWILKYPIDKIPNHSICSCAYVKSCLKITNSKRKIEKEVKPHE